MSPGPGFARASSFTSLRWQPVTTGLRDGAFGPERVRWSGQIGRAAGCAQRSQGGAVGQGPMAGDM